MSGTNSQRHPHKYMKVDGTWYCALPDCTHFMPRNMKLGVLGKTSICWTCGEEFILDERAMKMEQPVCFTCTDEGKAAKDFDIEEFERLQREKLRRESLSEKLIDTPLIGE